MVSLPSTHTQGSFPPISTPPLVCLIDGYLLIHLPNLRFCAPPMTPMILLIPSFPPRAFPMGKELYLRGEFLCSRLSSAIKPCMLYFLLPRQECVTDEVGWIWSHLWPHPQIPRPRPGRDQPEEEDPGAALPRHEDRHRCVACFAPLAWVDSAHLLACSEAASLLVVTVFQ